MNTTLQENSHIIDLNRKVLFEGGLENSVVNFSPLATGIDIMKITDGSKAITRKVMKN